MHVCGESLDFFGGGEDTGLCSQLASLTWWGDAQGLLELPPKF